MSSALPFREVSDADAILNFIFDKNKSFIGAAPSVESARPAAPAAPPSASDPEWQDHLRGTETETAAITAAEGGDFRSAQTLLDKLCADMPERASAFNNRAQLRRLQKDAAGSMTDLDTAIACGERWLKAHPEDAGSGCAVARTKLRAFHRQVLQQAYTQRAICHRSAGDSDKELADLHAAARCGSVLAKSVTTGLNPFATLCSDTVAVMLAQQAAAPGGPTVAAAGHSSAAAGAPAGAGAGAVAGSGASDSARASPPAAAAALPSSS